MKTVQFIFTAVLLLAFNSIFAQSENVIDVKKITSEIIIDGKADDIAWQNVKAYSFDTFYGAEKTTDTQKTSWKILWDHKKLYVLFECEDKFITAEEKQRDGAPYEDDCAEIFLIPSPHNIHLHFGFELNLYKTANDFVYLNNINQGGWVSIKSYNPDYEVGVSIEATLNNNSDEDKGWTMEMAIPFEVFHSAGTFIQAEEGAVWTFLALRQDRNDIEIGKRTTSTLFPLLEDKDVHNSKCFGYLKFK